MKTAHFKSIVSSSAAIYKSYLVNCCCRWYRSIRNIQLLILQRLFMHTLFGITLVLYLLKLSAGKGLWSCSSSIKWKFQPFLAVSVGFLSFFLQKAARVFLALACWFPQTLGFKFSASGSVPVIFSQWFVWNRNLNVSL